MSHPMVTGSSDSSDPTGDTEDREYCCNRYALWFLVIQRGPEMHRPECMPDAYTEAHDEPARP